MQQAPKNQMTHLYSDEQGNDNYDITKLNLKGYYYRDSCLYDEQPGHDYHLFYIFRTPVFYQILARYSYRMIFLHSNWHDYH
jgi:hypothetical protein